MIPLLHALCIGAAVFTEQDIAGLHVGTSHFPAPAVPVNTYITDVNRDGQPDLVLPRNVLLQIAGRFPASAAVRHPENGDFTAFRIEYDLFYGYRAGRLVCYRYLGGTWSMFWEDVIHDEIDNAIVPILEDIDGDGHTELLLPGSTLLSVYRIARGAVEAGKLDVYPPRRPEPLVVHDLWREFDAPEAPSMVSRRFRASFFAGSVSVHEVLAGTPDILDHRITEYRLEPDMSGVFTARGTDSRSFVGLASYLAPCRLNADNLLDFAGLRSTSPTLSWTPPRTDIAVLEGRHKETQWIRTKSLASHIAASDFDADRDIDIFTQSSPLMSAPPREMLMAAAAQRRIDHLVQVHVQNLEGEFDPVPREVFRTRIRFERPLASGGTRWDVYRTGGLASTQGDFNADGRSDLAVWRTPREIAVHLNHEGVYEDREDAVLSVPKEFSRMTVTDVDRDGKSDIILIRGADTDGPARVFFSR